MAKGAGIRRDERISIYKQSLARQIKISKLKVHLGNQRNILTLKTKMISYYIYIYIYIYIL